jgi:hypothetical protein
VPSTEMLGVFYYLKLYIMPTIDIPDKICPHCGGIRWKIEHEKRKYGIRTRYRCTKKEDERNKKWREKNLEKVREYNKKSCKKRREQGYYKNFKVKEYARLKSKKESDTLANNFIYRMLLNSPDSRDINRSEIPQQLVEIKRKQLLLTRQIKNNVKNN